MENITRLRLWLDEAPFDRTQPLHVSVGGAVPIVLPAPLPESILVAQAGSAWVLEQAAPVAPYRLHTPEGAAQLFNGEPLLIVHGTRGDVAVREAMQAAAAIASRSSNPLWEAPSGDLGVEGVPHNQNLYGELRVKADVDVTADDISRCHLVVIGTAAQNRVLGQMADALPVAFGGGRIACSDGIEIESAGNALALVHFNPLAPDRLVFCVASDDPAAYAADSAAVALLGRGAPMADMVVARGDAPTLVLARSFDSRWRWADDRENSPHLAASLRTHRALAEAQADVLRAATGAEFAISVTPVPGDEEAIEPGVTRIADLLHVSSYESLGVMTLSGADLLLAASRFAEAARPGGSESWIHPRPEADQINPAGTYRVAASAGGIWFFGRTARMNPVDYRLSELTVAEAMEQYSGMLR